jgi:hypothetical protein
MGPISCIPKSLIKAIKKEKKATMIKIEFSILNLNCRRFSSAVNVNPLCKKLSIFMYLPHPL